MPIQNVGTLLENLVVTEAALALLRRCHERAPLEFLNSFAMPPSTPWVPHAQNGGFDSATLDRVRAALDSVSPQGLTYANLLSANLRSHSGHGPNAALLVAGAALQTGVPCRMWLNDVRGGHYGDAIPDLERIECAARAIYGIQNGNASAFTVRVSDAAYPDSIADLARVLAEWTRSAGARLAFLDPMRYRLRDRRPAETSSEDHRHWLRRIAFDGLACAVHFTGNRNSADLLRELSSLQNDAHAEGYAASRAFQRQHYVVFLAVRSPRSAESDDAAEEVEGRVQKAWSSWGQTLALRRTWQLRIHRTGLAQ